MGGAAEAAAVAVMGENGAMEGTTEAVAAEATTAAAMEVKAVAGVSAAETAVTAAVAAETEVTVGSPRQCTAQSR